MLLSEYVSRASPGGGGRQRRARKQRVRLAFSLTSFVRSKAFVFTAWMSHFSGESQGAMRWGAAAAASGSVNGGGDDLIRLKSVWGVEKAVAEEKRSYECCLYTQTWLCQYEDDTLTECWYYQNYKNKAPSIHFAQRFLQLAFSSHRHQTCYTIIWHLLPNPTGTGQKAVSSMVGYPDP